MKSAHFSRRHVFGLLLGATLALAACEKLDAPADPVWGKEPCGHCAMLVGDRRFAAQAVTDKDRKYFDDIGCLALWASERPESVRLMWVRDAAGGQWLDAKSARFLHGARTPMDFGFEAHAGAITGEGGRDTTVGWEEVRARVIERARGDSHERSDR